MSGLERIVVGYRADERGARYPGAVVSGRCEGCGCDVYLVPSGQERVRAGDALVVCSFCHDAHYDEIMAKL